MKNPLRSRIVLVTVLTIVGFLCVSGVLGRRQVASFLAEHESRIQQVDKRSLFRELASVRLLTAAVAVGALSLTLALVWRRRVSQPMELISDRIREMRQGTWSHPIPVEQDDEIGTLVREFNDLG